MSFPTRHHHSNTWLTPPHILAQLGPFDTDPCAPEENPAWANTPTAYTEADNGLAQPWVGRVWLQPTVWAWYRTVAPTHGRTH